MLPSKRPIHNSLFTTNIVSRFPAWMKLRKPDSVGFRFLDALIGNELELFNNTLNVYKEYNKITKTPIDSLENVYFVELDYFLKDLYITDDNGNKIYIIESILEFLTNPPTRIVQTDTINPSGLTGNIVGLEWLDLYPSGYLLVKQDISDNEPSGLLYYKTSSLNNIVEDNPVSGTTLGLGYVGLGQNALYDILEPESEWSLKKKYPSNQWVDISGNVSSTIPSGIIWDKQYYIDFETNEKIYHHKMLNNPYGSGVYNFADVKLQLLPIYDTVKIYDIMNVTSSGTSTEIASSGTIYYVYTSGVWSYKGFENPIPWDITPIDIQEEIKENNNGSGIPIIPNSGGVVSWRFLPLSGYVDDEVYPHSGTFNWVDGTGPSGVTIRFDGAFSKYEAQYAYEQYKNVTAISAEPKTQHNPAAQTEDITFINSEDIVNKVDFETSETSENAIRISPYTIRPGTSLNFNLNINSFISETWLNAKTTDKTILFYNNNIGYTNDLGIISNV